MRPRNIIIKSTPYCPTQGKTKQVFHYLQHMLFVVEGRIFKEKGVDHNLICSPLPTLLRDMAGKESDG